MGNMGARGGPGEHGVNGEHGCQGGPGEHGVNGEHGCQGGPHGCFSLEPFTYVAPYPRAGNPRNALQLFSVSSSLFSFFSTPASHFSSSISSKDKV